MQRKFADFNARAREWNLQPKYLQRTEALAEHIRDKIRLEKDSTEALDFGCGTGKLSILLAPYLKRITAVDGASAMIDELTSDLMAGGIGNVQAKTLDIEHEIRLLRGQKFDLIYSMMVMHHIEKPGKVLQNIKSLLKPEGILCIIDLDKEDGSFHGGSDFIPHKGFERDKFKKVMERYGYFNVTLHTPHIIKRDNDGEVREYPLFMAIADNAPPKFKEKTT